MRRRHFIAGLGGVVAWPLAARAQQDARVRRIGILTRSDETDRRVQAEQSALREELTKLGWIEGRNVEFYVRYSADDPDRLRAHVDELVRLAPHVIVVGSWPATQLMLQRTQIIPIVFINVGDPVAGGLLQNIARPEGNVTGITSVYQSMGGKMAGVAEGGRAAHHPGCACLRSGNRHRKLLRCNRSGRKSFGLEDDQSAVSQFR